MKFKQQAGFSLIEVLIAMCLIAIMLLGLEELQLASTHSKLQAFNMDKATTQLQTMADLIQLSKGKYTDFLSVWNQDNKKLLPKGYGETKRHGNAFNIYIFWRVGNSKKIWKCDLSPKINEACLQLQI